MLIALRESLTKFKEYKEDIDQASMMVWREVPIEDDDVQLHFCKQGVKIRAIIYCQSNILGKVAKP